MLLTESLGYHLHRTGQKAKTYTDDMSPVFTAVYCFDFTFLNLLFSITLFYRQSAGQCYYCKRTDYEL